MNVYHWVSTVTTYHFKNFTLSQFPFDKPISGQVDSAFATETVDSGLIPGRVKPKTIKIGIYSFPA